MDKYISKAAIKYGDKIYTGFNHGESITQLLSVYPHKTITSHDIEEGFVTSDGIFVNRKEAAVIAKEQANYEIDVDYLMSEYVYLDWLHRQEREIKTLKRKLGRATRNEKRLKHKLEAQYTDYCLLEDALENSDLWLDDYKRRLRNAYKKINRLKEELENATKNNKDNNI